MLSTVYSNLLFKMFVRVFVWRTDFLFTDPGLGLWLKEDWLEYHGAPNEGQTLAWDYLLRQAYLKCLLALTKSVIGTPLIIRGQKMATKVLRLAHIVCIKSIPLYPPNTAHLSWLGLTQPHATKWMANHYIKTTILCERNAPRDAMWLSRIPSKKMKNSLSHTIIVFFCKL